MRREMLEALKALSIGSIKKAKMNVEVYLANPVGIGEHSNVVEAIEEEINMIAKYQDQIDVINTYFRSKEKVQNLNEGQEGSEVNYQEG